MNGDLEKHFSCKAVSFVYGPRQALPPIHTSSPSDDDFPEAQVFIMESAPDKCSTNAQTESYPGSREIDVRPDFDGICMVKDDFQPHSIDSALRVDLIRAQVPHGIPSTR